MGDVEFEQRLAADLERRDELQARLDARRAAERAQLAALQAELDGCEAKRTSALAAQARDERALVKTREDERRFSVALDQTRRLVAQLVTPTFGGAATFATAIFLALPPMSRAFAFGAVAAGLAVGLGVAWVRRSDS